MRASLVVAVFAVKIGPATAETYSTKDQFGMVRNHATHPKLIFGTVSFCRRRTKDQFGMVRNHATHEEAEQIILNGDILSGGRWVARYKTWH